MKRMSNMNFKTKLTALLVGISAVSLILVSIGFSVTEFQSAKEAQQREATTLAKALAYNLSATLAFSDSEGAIDLLQALQTNATIISADIINNQGKTFARYGIKPSNAVNLLTVHEPISIRHQKLGDLYMYVKTPAWFEYIQRQLPIILLIALLALLTALGLSTWLQRGVVLSVSELARAMQQVREQRNYSIRVTKNTNDEIGQLADGFNSMLEKIEKHENTLEKTVASRTIELARELDDRKKAESALGLVLHGLNQTGEGVLLIDEDDQVQYWNAAFLGITGCQASDLKGDGSPIVASGVLSADAINICQTELNRSKHWQGDVQSTKKSGESYPSQVRVVRVTVDDTGDVFQIMTLRDMSQTRDMEHALRQAQKMEAVGVLTGGIAHDFNNLLTSIMGNAELARMNIDNTAPINRYIEVIESSSQRAAEMIKKLLAFSRKDIVDFKDHVLNDLVKGMDGLVKIAVPKDVHLSIDVDTEAMWIHADSSQIEQVVLNVVNNAVDAVAGVEAPSIRIGVSSFVPDEDFTTQHVGVESVAYAHITVSDNGYGIDMKDRNQVFEPFFTTKGVGKGTGLGLSMVYGTVQRHQGVIDFESEQGCGTSFHIYIPLTQPHLEAQSVTEIQEIEPINQLADRVKTALIVDDEPTVREIAKELLEDLGYKVLLATNGAEGVEVYNEHQQAIDFILMDMVMPKMGGAEAARHIRKVRADIPVIFVTGYDRERALEDTEDMRNIAVLTKPYRFETLISLIDELTENNA